MPANTASAWENIHAGAPVCDLHIHPAMNRLVIRQNLNVRGIVSRSFSPFSVRASWPQMKQGGYSAILSVVDLPERGLVKDFPIIRPVAVLHAIEGAHSLGMDDASKVVRPNASKNPGRECAAGGA